MKIFDLHCDTIEALKNNNETFDNSITQFTMKNQEKLDKAVQFLAVWVPDHLRGQEAVDFTNGYYEYMKEAVGKIADRAALVEDISDLDTILNERKWAFIRSIESGAALGGKLENVDHFAKLNFKMMTLTWNGINELGSGSQSEMGLTDFGKAVVRRMEEVGMIVDCSHLNDAGFENLLNCSAKPFVASHSNLRALCSHSRNLRDDQFKEIVARGGLCGINVHSKFLSEPDDLGAGQKEQLLRLIDRMLELGGEDVIAWGMDLDGGVTCDPSIGTPYGGAAYGEYLVEHGISRKIVDKLSFDNAYRFFTRDQKRCNS